LKVIEPGHIYELKQLDGEGVETLRFVKRVGEKYPGNEPPAHPGTNMQEHLRALINRCEFVNGQNYCIETVVAIQLMKGAIAQFELRAARLHGRNLDNYTLDELVRCGTCDECGHIGCNGECRK
jgi:hypothetical protein